MRSTLALLACVVSACIACGQGAKQNTNEETATTSAPLTMDGSGGLYYSIAGGGVGAVNPRAAQNGSTVLMVAPAVTVSSQAEFGPPVYWINRSGTWSSQITTWPSTPSQVGSVPGWGTLAYPVQTGNPGQFVVFTGIQGVGGGNLNLGAVVLNNGATSFSNPVLISMEGTQALNPAVTWVSAAYSPNTGAIYVLFTGSDNQWLQKITVDSSGNISFPWGQGSPRNPSGGHWSGVISPSIAVSYYGNQDNLIAGFFTAGSTGIFNNTCPNNNVDSVYAWEEVNVDAAMTEWTAYGVPSDTTNEFNFHECVGPNHAYVDSPTVFVWGDTVNSFWHYVMPQEDPHSNPDGGAPTTMAIQDYEEGIYTMGTFVQGEWGGCYSGAGPNWICPGGDQWAPLMATSQIGVDGTKYEALSWIDSRNGPASPFATVYNSTNNGSWEVPALASYGYCSRPTGNYAYNALTGGNGSQVFTFACTGYNFQNHDEWIGYNTFQY